MPVQAAIRIAVCLLSIAGVHLAGPPSAVAQGYPTRPIRLIVPFPPGTGNDVVGRIIGQKLTERTGQPVVYDNRSGASGIIAVDAARRATPDGYTLIIASSSFSINMHTLKDAGYNLTHFAPIAVVGKLPYSLVVPASVPAKSLQELIALAKAKAGQFSAATGGNSSTGFFLVESLKRVEGLDIAVVSYKGTTPALVDLLTGRTQLMFATLVTNMPHHTSGKLRTLGVTGTKRNPLIPDIPTFRELGFPMLDVPTWFAFLAPTGTPRAIVTKLNDEINRALGLKDVNEQLGKLGVEPSITTPEEAEAYLKADSALWAKAVKDAGIQAR